MKKFKFGILLLVVMLFISGCNLSAADRIMEADKNMDELDNFNMKMVLDMGMDVDGEALNVSLNATAKIDMKNQTSYVNMEGKSLEYLMNIEMYAIADGDIATVYTKMTGNEELDGLDEWFKISVPNEEANSQSEDVTEIIDIVSNGASIEEKGTNDGITHYIVTLDKESVQKLFTISSELSNNEVSEDDYEIVGDMKVDIYLNEDNYITSMEMDFANVISYNIENQEVKMNEFKIKYDFSDFNSAGTITVPQDVIDSAVEMELE